MIKNFRFLVIFVLLFATSFNGNAQVVTTLVSGLPDAVGIAIGTLDTLYVGDAIGFRIRKVDPAGTASIFVGSGVSGATDGTGTAATIQYPTDFDLDPASGNFYFTQIPGAQVRKVTPLGVVTTITTVTGDGGGIAIGKNDTLYTYSRSTGDFYKINPLGVVTFIATLPGNGWDLEFLSPDTLYLAGTLSQQIFQIDHTGAYTVLAGSGSPSFGDGTGLAAGFNYPTGITIDGAGILFVADNGNNRIRKVTQAGVVTTLAGNGTGATTDGTGTGASFNQPLGITISPATGNLFVTERVGAVRIVTGAVPLPLKWLSYAASLSAQNKAQINWTVSEISVNSYQILKSTDGKNFEPITMINSKGNGENSYSYTEAKSLNGTAYYRIQQTDINGQSTNSATMSLQNKGIDNTTKVYPTAFTNGLTIESSAAQHAKLTNLNGQLIQLIELKSGKNHIATEHLAAGVYYIQTDFSAHKLIKN